MSSTTIQILHHGNCFDGLVSAAIFTRFFADGPYPGAHVSTRGMLHGPGDPYGDDHDATFHAAVNAVADFRYSPSPRLTWFCDHHPTSCLCPADAVHLGADTSGRQLLDATAPSCAGLLVRWLEERHGLARGLFVEHARWADLIDAARFTSPAQAVELREPALQLMQLLEAAPSPAFSDRLIAALAYGSVEQAAAAPEVQRAVQPMLEEHQRTIAAFGRRLTMERGVAFADLVEEGVEGFNKFIPYHLAADLRYTVVVTRTPRRAKVSVGSNPWRRPEPLCDLGALCKQHGGGGHAVVGAISLAPEDLPTARRAAAAIVALLRAA